ncbi:FmdB family transcriptional regulator [beta proteobacterium AAP121]|nr:FmdB family transcriptional regulator [beta proteobacterium AAP65]KPF96100.1 FmdB family transcriptional regulator [beta proteobacterium AAP121]
MPIYAYRCNSCGHAQDVLQKMSDPVLTACPACGAATYAKQVTAAGFQLKGSGWYVTDFRGGNSGAPKPEAKTEGAPGTSAPAVATPAPAAASTESKPAAAPAAPAPAPSSGSAA